MDPSRLVMANLKIDNHFLELRTGFHLIGSNENIEIYINSKTIDGKHALLEISSYGMKIFDLKSKNGTFINGNKIDGMKLVQLPNKCQIQFGNINGDLKLLSKNDSGFSERLTTSKDTSEIIISSPERNSETHTLSVHNKHTKTITSTPNNNDTKLKTECSLPKYGNINSLQNKIDENEINSKIERDNENDNSSFFVPETQQIRVRTNKKNISTSNYHDSTKGDSKNNASSFFVPETQQIDLKAEDDDFFIPETQQFDNENNKSQNLASQCGSLYKISTQDFNASPGPCGLLDGSSDLSNNSENLFNGIELSANVPLIKPEELKINNLRSNLEKSTNAKSNYFTDDGSDYDAEMSALKWQDSNQTERKSIVQPGSNSVTPEFLLESIIIENNNNLKIQRDGSITPDLFVEINNAERNSINFGVIPKTEEGKNTNSFKGFLNQNNSIEQELEPTQLYIKPKKQNTNNKSIQKINLLTSNDDDLEPTQLFVKHISLCNHSDKENSINLKKSNECNLDTNKESTQLFIPPKRRKSIINNNLSNVDIDNSLEPTQPFIREKINRTAAPEKNAISDFILESDDDENSPIKLNVTKKRNKLMSSSDEEDNFLQNNIFKTPFSSRTKKTNSNCSSNISTTQQTENGSTSSNRAGLSKKHNNKSIDSNSQHSFDFITSTPQFDFIKPHQSVDIKQAGHLFSNVKSKNNKILLEESSDDDDSQCIENLIKLLDEKNCKNRIKKSPNIETKSAINKSTKNTRKRTASQNTQDSTTTQIRQSKRIKTKPNYINQSYITDNFTEHLSSNSDNRSLRKRSAKTNLEDNDLHLKKIKQSTSTSQQHNKERKKKVNKIDDNEKNSDMEPIANTLFENNNNRTTRSCKKILKHKFVFTIVEASKYRSTIESMDGKIVDNPKDATILITNGIMRTSKFMVALARGIPIVSHKWLDAIMISPNISTSHDNFLINDPANEKKFQFSLTKTLELSAKNSIFENYTFLITPKTQPQPSELIQIITCSGGQYVQKIPKGSINISKFYVVSDIADKKLWPKIRKSIPNVNIVSTEGILLSVMQHSIRLNDHLLFD